MQKVFDFSHQFGINCIWEQKRRILSVNSIFSNFESNLIGFASQICRVRVSLTITASAKPKHAFSSFCTYQWIILSHPWCSAFLYCLLIGNLVNLIFAVLTSTRQILADFFTRTFFKKMGHSWPLFLYFRLFNTQLTVNKCSI